MDELGFRIKKVPALVNCYCCHYLMCQISYLRNWIVQFCISDVVGKHAKLMSQLLNLSNVHKLMTKKDVEKKS